MERLGHASDHMVLVLKDLGKTIRHIRERPRNWTVRGTLGENFVYGCTENPHGNPSLPNGTAGNRQAARQKSKQAGKLTDVRAEPCDIWVPVINCGTPLKLRIVRIYPKVTIKRTTLQMPHITVQMPHITVQMPHVTVQMPHITVQMPHVTVQMPHVTVQMPHVTVQMRILLYRYRILLYSAKPGDGYLNQESPRTHLHMVGMLRCMFWKETNRAFPHHSSSFGRASRRLRDSLCHWRETAVYVCVTERRDATGKPRDRLWRWHWLFYQLVLL